jgi:hypothetical protein
VEVVQFRDYGLSYSGCFFFLFCHWLFLSNWG